MTMKSTPVFLEVLTGMLASGRPVKFIAGGDSMWPSIRRGDTLVVEPALSYTPGDVLLVLVAGRPVAHRYVADDRGRIVTAGDRIVECDRPVERREVLGRVTAIERDGVRRPVRESVPLIRRAANAAVFAMAAAARRALATFVVFVPRVLEE